MTNTHKIYFGVQVSENQIGDHLKCVPDTIKITIYTKIIIQRKIKKTIVVTSKKSIKKKSAIS